MRSQGDTPAEAPIFAWRPFLTTSCIRLYAYVEHTRPTTLRARAPARLPLVRTYALLAASYAQLTPRRRGAGCSFLCWFFLRFFGGYLLHFFYFSRVSLCFSAFSCTFFLAFLRFSAFFLRFLRFTVFSAFLCVFLRFLCFFAFCVFCVFLFDSQRFCRCLYAVLSLGSARVVVCLARSAVEWRRTHPIGHAGARAIATRR